MLAYAKNSVSRQIIALLVITSLSALLLFLFDIQPRLRFSGGMFFRGILGGLVVGITVLLFHASLVFTRRAYYLPILKQLISENNSLPILTAMGWAISVAVGEELLLRGSIFGALRHWNFFAALVLNSVPASLFAYRKGTSLAILFIIALEAMLYALLFNHTKSLLMVTLTHGIAVAVVIWVSRQKFLEDMLNLEISSHDK